MPISSRPIARGMEITFEVPVSAKVGSTTRTPRKNTPSCISSRKAWHWSSMTIRIPQMVTSSPPTGRRTTTVATATDSTAPAVQGCWHSQNGSKKMKSRITTGLGDRARPRALSGAPRARLVVPPPACGRISFRSGPRGASLNARGGRGPREFRPASAPSAFSLPSSQTKTTLINSEK